MAGGTYNTLTSRGQNSRGHRKVTPSEFHENWYIGAFQHPHHETEEKYDHVTPLIKELQWMTIKDKYVYEKCIIMFKALNGMYPECLLKFSTVGGTTRQVDNLYVPRTRTDSGTRASTVIGPVLWNDLPGCITNSGSLHSFKSRLRNRILSSE